MIQSKYPVGYVGNLGLLSLNGKPQTLKIGADGTIHFGYPLFSYIANFWGPLDRMGVSFPRLECLENPLRVLSSNPSCAAQAYCRWLIDSD